MRRLAIGLCVVSLILSACGDAETRTLTETDNLDEVVIDSGDELEIHLVSNPSTGFRWVIDEISMPEGLTLMEDRYEGPETTLVGAPGTQVLTLEATEEGAGILRLEYVRPFDDPPSQSE